MQLNPMPRLLVGLLAVAALACSPSPAPTESERPFAAEGANVLLITVDTLRADRLGAYGFGGVATPVIDALATTGVRFAAAYSPTPLTLPAHTSIMTGTYPVHHGVRDNVAYEVPEEIDTLAEILAGRGYRTGAFVSAFVLDSRWGIGQGFDTYYDEFDTGGETRFLVGGGQQGLERTADDVVDHALDWLQGSGDEPFFLWVHLFDPHAPYAAPEPFGSRYAEAPYLGEIAFADSQVGRLVGHLDEMGLRDRTVVALTGDHGESLGEHGEAQHGLFIYEETMHVPLIFSTPGSPWEGVVRPEPVSLVDVAPTLLSLVGAPALEPIQGRDLSSIFDPSVAAEPRSIHIESWYGRFHYGWSELRGLVTERHKLIESSEPELFDLQQDVEEEVNLVDQLNTVYLRLHTELAELESQWASANHPAGTGSVDSETRQRLQALGYVGSVRVMDDDPDVPLPSPRSRIQVYNKTLAARGAMTRRRLDDAEALLREVVAEDAGVLEAQRMLGEVYTLQGRHSEAAEVLRAAVPLNPDDPEAHLLLADALVAAGDLGAAERSLEAAIEFVEPSAEIQLTLGSTRARMGDLQGAARAFEDSLALEPESEYAHSGLAQVQLGMNDTRRAREHALAALAGDPTMPRAHFVLAEVARREGDIEVAASEYEAELANDPGHVVARFNLAMAYREIGRTEDERVALGELVRRAPGFLPGSLMLGRALLEQGTQLPQAQSLVQDALNAPIGDRQRLLGYQLMAELRSRMGDREGAAHWSNLGAALRRKLEG